jgi:prolipoprotein diacylglyceryltransferase
MSEILAFITWDVNPNLIESPIMVRYYGVLWAVSFFIGLFLMRKMMANDNAPDEYTDKVFIYVLIGAVLGARLGHVIFYDWDEYKNNLVDILKIWEGGLASHGGLIGVVLATWLYSKRVAKKSFLWSADKIVVTVALAACLIRVGNLMNSEIIGRESDSDMAMFFKYSAEEDIASQIARSTDEQIIAQDVEIDYQNANENVCVVKIKVISEGTISQENLTNLKTNLKSWHSEESQFFDPYNDHIKTSQNADMDLVQVDGNKGFIRFNVEIIPRIPTQIWEAVSYLLIFIFLFWAYWKQHWYKKEGLLFGLFLTLLFGARFIIEFFKENQVDDITDAAMLNMGQRLSIPAVLVGIFFIVRAFKNPEKDTKVTIETPKK